MPHFNASKFGHIISSFYEAAVQTTQRRCGVR
jgi:hypothetical protein